MIIQFKSKEPYFSKEEEGYKCNTVREVSQDDSRFDDLMELIQADDYAEKKAIIKMVNPETNESFERQITDVTYYDERFIISWRQKKD